MKNNYFLLIIFSLVMLVVFFARIRLLNIPLERDEAEYSYMGQLMLRGIPPYEMAYNMKFPGTHIMYALFMLVFCETTMGVHLGLLVINIGSVILLYLLAKKLISNNAGYIAAAVYALLSISDSVYGFAAHATHFLIFPALAGSYLLLKSVESEKKIWYFLSGILLGVVPIMKQQGVFFCLFGAIFLILTHFIYHKTNIKSFGFRFLIFIAGGIIPILLLVSALMLFGVFDKFWFWTFQYAAEYEQQFDLLSAFQIFKKMSVVVMGDYYLIWILAGLGLVAVFLKQYLKKYPSKLFILLFIVCSFLSVCPGFYFRHHYFIVFLPSIAILFSIIIDYIISRRGKIPFKYIGYGILVISLIHGILLQSCYLFRQDPEQIIRNTYGYGSPFLESVKIAEYIKTHSNKHDKIAVIGSEPEIFFYANRQSATGYIYTFSLNENQKYKYEMQKEMIQEIEISEPRFIVYFPDSIYHITKWFLPYINKYNYSVKGVVDMYPGNTIYKWDNEAYSYKPGADVYAVIYERGTNSNTLTK